MRLRIAYIAPSEQVASLNFPRGAAETKVKVGAPYGALNFPNLHNSG